MTAEETLEEIQEHARWGRVSLTAHARKRMRERSVALDDVYEAIATVQFCVGQDDGTWRLEGFDMDGDELTVIVELEGEDLIITVF